MAKSISPTQCWPGLSRRAYWSTITLQRDPWLASLRSTPEFGHIFEDVKPREEKARIAFLEAGGEHLLMCATERSKTESGKLNPAQSHGAEAMAMKSNQDQWRKEIRERFERAESHPTKQGDPMSAKLKPTHTQPGGFQEERPESEDDEVVNDSFGTIDIADSSGLDEDKETGDAKALNKDTHED